MLSVERILSNFQSCNVRNNLEMTVCPSCISVPPGVLLYSSLFPYLFLVLPPISSLLLAFEFLVS